MIGQLKISALLDGLLIAYICSLIFFYPFGIPVLGNNNIRISDIIAFPLLALGLISFFQFGSIKKLPLLNSIILLFVVFELFYPLLGLFVGYEGLGAFGNTLRMTLIWLPFYLYILINEEGKVEKIDKYLNRILKVSLLLNIGYGLIQIAVKVRILPYNFLITKYLEPFAVDSHFRVTDGIRASGFFVNTTALSVFAILSLSYFLGRFIGKKRVEDSVYILISFVAIILTTSRAAVFTGALILGIGWLFFDRKRKLITLLIFTVVAGLMFTLIEVYIGSEVLFERFIRLAEVGAQDNSFAARSDRIWPRVLQRLEEFEMGTLVNAVSKVGLIDSGYLTYYSQGKWPFLFVLVAFLGAIIFCGLNIFRNSKNWGNFMVLAIGIYLVSTMVVLNPLRSPIVIFFLLFGLWMSETYKTRNVEN